MSSPHKILTDTMLLHKGNEVSLGKQLGWAGLPIHHFHSAGLKAEALLIDGEELQEEQVWRSDHFVITPRLALLHQAAQLEHTCCPLPGWAHLLITLSLQ